MLVVDVALLDRVQNEVATQKEAIGLTPEQPIVRRPESYRAWDSEGFPD